jgi:hypothetical protein
MIKKFNIVILVSILFFIALSSCNKESTLPIQNDNQISTSELKSLVSQVKFWHDSIVSNKTRSINVENNVKSFSLGPDDIIPPSIDFDKAYKNFDTVEKKGISIPLEFDLITGNYLQFVTSIEKNKISGFIVRTIPDSSYRVKHKNIYDYTNFTGAIIVYDIKGKFLNKIKFNEGVTQIANSLSLINIEKIKSFDDLQTVTVTGYRKKKRTYLVINQNFSYDMDYGGGGGGDWVVVGGDAPAGVVDDIKNNTTDPCISSVMNDILSKDKQNKVMSYINNEFGLNENCNMNISDVLNLTNSKGLRVAGNSIANRNNGILTVNISINYGKNSSKEFIAATILHEMIHGYIASQNIAQNGMEKEEVIANSQYVSWMSASLISLFPNLSSIDANALALGGLQETSYFKSLSKDTQDASNATNARHELGNEGQTCK